MYSLMHFYRGFVLFATNIFCKVYLQSFHCIFDNSLSSINSRGISATREIRAAMRIFDCILKKKMVIIIEETPT